MTPAPFRAGARRVVIVLAAVIAAALVVVLVTPKPDRGAKAGADSFSRSAVGHAAFLALLRDEGVSVQISRRGRGRTNRPGTTHLLLEPPAGVDVPLWPDDPEVVRVLVLPKWEVEAEPRGDRVRTAKLLPSAAVLRFAPYARLVREDAPATCDGEIDLPFPQLLEVNPNLLRDYYDAEVTPVLKCGDRILAAQVSDGESVQFLVTDPDLLNNWGIGRGSNADAVLGLVKGLGRPVVIDESIHGYGPPTSLLAELRQFPLNLVPIHLAVLAAVVLWAGARRFGPWRGPPSRLPPGGETLAQHAAVLLTDSGSPQWTVGQTWARSLHRLSERYHLAGDGQTLARLDAIATARGLTERASGIDAAVRSSAAPGGLFARFGSAHERSLFALVRRITDFERSLTRDR